MVMKRDKNTNSIKWLIAGLLVWIATVPLLSGISESPVKAFGIILAWLALPVIYAVKNNDFEGIGITSKNLKNALAGMLAVSILYSVIRNLLIVFVPSSINFLAASALTVAELLKQGYFGNIAGPFSKLFPIMFFLTFLAAVSNELFYRGFLFTHLRQFVDWRLAIIISALMFGAYHYLNVGVSGFIMGIVVSIVSGWLMQKYNNIVAPALFHFIQYILTILVFYYLVI
ncbi:MAG: CPBP family intramembrane metalloprotease [Candidatus Methanoperedens sp.]|nr:CPBP family intramembrane metalloprotease [Candidatus Methanoperedens sp.]